MIALAVLFSLAAIAFVVLRVRETMRRRRECAEVYERNAPKRRAVS